MQEVALCLHNRFAKAKRSEGFFFFIIKKYLCFETLSKANIAANNYINSLNYIIIKFMLVILR